MKWVICVISVLFLFSSLALAQEGEPDTVTLIGHIVDNKTLAVERADEISDFPMGRSKEDTPKPQGVGIGYSLSVKGKLYRFDKESDVAIEDFLKKSDSKENVVVEAKRSISGLKLISIKNQKNKK